MSLFDDVVAFLGQSPSIEELGVESQVESREAVRIGVVVSLPVVIANLASWVEDPAGAYWLAARLADMETSKLDSYRALSRAYDVEELGGGLLDLILGDRWDRVTEQIVERAKISTSSANRVLAAAAATVLLYLARGPTVRSAMSSWSNSSQRTASN